MLGRAASRTGRPAWPSTTIAKAGAPRRIGFLPIDGGGLHRLWYVGGRYAYASALIEGFSDYIFIIIDLQDPTSRARRAVSGCPA